MAGTYRVDRVVSIAADGYPDYRQMQRFGKAERIGGAIVSPGCGEPSLTTHDLSRFVDRWERTPPSKHFLGWCLDGAFTNIKLGLEPAPSPTTTLARFVQGKGLTCEPPPAGYTRHGFASETLGVPRGTYPYYAP
jgi:hypothetical protein